MLHVSAPHTTALLTFDETPDLCVWWLSRRDLDALGPAREDDVLPVLVRRVIRARFDAPDGRIWGTTLTGEVVVVPELRLGEGPLARSLRQSLGILMSTADLPALRYLPGLVTDADGQRIDLDPSALCGQSARWWLDGWDEACLPADAVARLPAAVRDQLGRLSRTGAVVLGEHLDSLRHRLGYCRPVDVRVEDLDYLAGLPGLVTTAGLERLVPCRPAEPAAAASDEPFQVDWTRQTPDLEPVVAAVVTDYPELLGKTALEMLEALHLRLQRLQPPPRDDEYGVRRPGLRVAASSCPAQGPLGQVVLEVPRELLEDGVLHVGQRLRVLVDSE